MRRPSTSISALLLAGSLAACRRSDPPNEAWPPQHPPAPPVAAPVEIPAPPAPRYPPPLPPPPMPSAPVPAPQQALPGATVVTRPDGGTVNGNPRGPRAEALNAVLQSTLPALQRCFESWAELPPAYDADIRVNYRVLPSGRTAGVAVSGQVAHPVEACVVGVFETLRFPEFEGEVISGSFPFGYHREAPRGPGR